MEHGNLNGDGEIKRMGIYTMARNLSICCLFMMLLSVGEKDIHYRYNKAIQWIAELLHGTRGSLFLFTKSESEKNRGR